MQKSQPADLVIANGTSPLPEGASNQPVGVAIRDGRIVMLGDYARLRPLIGAQTEVVDAAGGLILPAFHDAHLHLLSYARSFGRLQLSGPIDVRGLAQIVSQQATLSPPGVWVRAVGYDPIESHDRPPLDRGVLDAAAPDHPVRIQHRTQHLDILNTIGLRALGLFDADLPQVQRDPVTRQPTGRLYHAAELLRSRSRGARAAELGLAVRQACRRLLSWGVTTVQDASITNSSEEWKLFDRLVNSGDLQLRVFMMPGSEYWRTFPQPGSTPSLLRSGPVKFMIIEGTTSPVELRASIDEVHRAGRSAALHAISEAEIVLALDALQASARRVEDTACDRIEHAANMPPALIKDVAGAGVSVVGQPTLVYTRGDRYLADHPRHQWPWLHRARSLVGSGVNYAASSDAPLTQPAPIVGMYAARERLTRQGRALGAEEKLSLRQAIRAFTVAPARAVGMEHELGQLRPGFLADIVIVDPEIVSMHGDAPPPPEVRATIMDGRVVWRRSRNSAGSERK